MFCKKSLPVLLWTLGCPACGRLSETTPESEGIEFTPIEVSTVEAVGEQTDSLTKHTDEDALSDPGCDTMDDSEVTGEAEQAVMEGPVVSNPWGDGASDSHTYTGGSGGGSLGGWVDTRIRATICPVICDSLVCAAVK